MLAAQVGAEVVVLQRPIQAAAAERVERSRAGAILLARLPSRRVARAAAAALGRAETQRVAQVQAARAQAAQVQAAQLRAARAAMQPQPAAEATPVAALAQPTRRA